MSGSRRGRATRWSAAALWAAWTAAAGAAESPPPAASQQTVVILRHGERAERGLGQLNCQGLNRALALPAVLLKKFGKPDIVFAPSPAFEKEDFGKPYSYVRPLATIEPTAIRFGLPLDATLGFSQIDKLQTRLEDPTLRGATVIVAWEHHLAAKLAKDLLTAHGGDPTSVPTWERNDFDSLYVVRITRTADKASATFTLDHEGLDGQPAECPTR